MTERIKELQSEIEALNKEKEEIGHQQFSLKVRASSIDKKLKAIEWAVKDLTECKYSRLSAPGRRSTAKERGIIRTLITNPHPGSVPAPLSG